MKFLIVDNDRNSRIKIRKLLEKFDSSFQIKESENAVHALSLLKNFQPNIVYQETEFPDMTGFEIIDKVELEILPILIFITTNDKFALRAFEKGACDYILKPYDEKRIYRSLYKALNLQKFQNRAFIEKKMYEVLNFSKNNNQVYKKLPVKLGNKTILINTSDIKYIVADRYYAEVHTTNKKHLIRQSISRLINLLDGRKFSRIHRSTIINFEYLKEIVHSGYAEIDIKMNDGNLFRVSRSYKKDLISQLGI